VDHSRYVGAFLDACSINARVAKDRVVFHVRGIESSVSRYRLQEAAAYLRGRAGLERQCQSAG
jgi:hypothetical protein